ncbi:MAG: chromosome segregation protein SMC [Desulfatiglans sp.]|jgi:chromosome segregation protein|nr:chromosome segregation protein SMC [Thermodesulfobacteriota bacterium]MEE4352859.1 chromosome segregation protein SMC [Desulfatiglans sp.]
MKIKKLSVLGFKSFMERIEITFPLGISGIVGPNGCGKSNVVDAIRWCMGEQSPKQLRGRKMEDVIFNGSGDQKPFGMAEVSIVFENGDNSFPPPFAMDAELAITRRLYRSGESEYRINNVPCRLKDIQEIFMDTGLGNKAYSIIGQGKIGAIVEQRPEDTRVMLEEASGVTKYRKKVEASERKIELTRSNLQRVEDILGEVEKQMRSLKRQANKAKRYRAICEEIKHLELVFYSNSYHQFKGESGEKLKSSEALVEQEVAKNTECSSILARTETMNLELEERDEVLSGLQKNRFDLKEKVHRYETDIESLSTEMRMQQELDLRLHDEKEEIKERLISLEEERGALQNAVEEIEERSLKMEEEISLREKRMSTRREFVREIKEQYEDARKKLNAGENRAVGLNHESGYLNKMLHQITDSRSRLESEAASVKEKMESILQTSEVKNLARDALCERIEEIEASLEQQEMRFRELQSLKEGIETELKSAEADLNIHATRLAGLKALSDNFEGFKMGVRTIMKAQDLEPYQKGHILGTVADVIQVDPRYEQAVEAILSDKLQYIIVETQDDGKLAIEYLKKRERGRSSFVPLQDLPKGHHDTLQGSLTPLSDLVSVPEDYRPLLNALLGDTVLVDNLEQALSLWKSNGKNLCFITPEGDVVDQRGIISGGKLARSSSGLLTRKREMEELKQRRVDAQKRVDALNAKLENVVEELRVQDDALEALKEDKWSCQDKLNDLEKILFRLGQELEQLDNLSQKISGDLDRKAIEERKHSRELKRVEEVLEEHRENRQREEEYFARKEAELKESEEEFELFREELAKLKGDYRILQEEQRSLSREMEMKEDYAYDSQKRLEKIEEDTALSHKKRTDSETRSAILQEELKGLCQNLEQAEEAVNHANLERHAFQSTIKEEESKAETLKEQIDALKEEINLAKMEHSEIRFKMNGLIETVREKTGLELPVIYTQYMDDEFSNNEVEEKLAHQKDLKQRLGEVNLTAIKEYEALKERNQFVQGQREDLISSIQSLEIAINKINKTSLERFRKTFHEVNEQLKKVFPILFNGGMAGLKLTDEAHPLESGVLVEVQPPGKKLSHMGLLSGGEKALVAMSLLFAIYMIKPSPFCLLDEVDAPLDEANIDRFNDLLKEIKRASQIIMVTHSRKTMEIVDRLYGITMERPGISKSVSVDLQGIRTQRNALMESPQMTMH